MGQSLTKYNATQKDNVSIYKVDYDTQYVIFKRYNVKTVPVLLYVKSGKVVGKEFGKKTPQQIARSVKKYFN